MLGFGFFLKEAMLYNLSVYIFQREGNIVVKEENLLPILYFN